MELLQTAHSYSTKSFHRISKFTHDVMVSYTQARNAHNTIKQLNRLSNKELRDIGLSRGEIFHVAHELEYKPRGDM